MRINCSHVASFQNMWPNKNTGHEYSHISSALVYENRHGLDEQNC